MVSTRIRIYLVYNFPQCFLCPSHPLLLVYRFSHINRRFIIAQAALGQEVVLVTNNKSHLSDLDYITRFNIGTIGNMKLDSATEEGNGKLIATGRGT